MALPNGKMFAINVITFGVCWFMLSCTTQTENYYEVYCIESIDDGIVGCLCR